MELAKVSVLLVDNPCGCLFGDLNFEQCKWYLVLFFDDGANDVKFDGAPFLILVVKIRKNLEFFIRLILMKKTNSFNFLARFDYRQLLFQFLDTICQSAVYFLIRLNFFLIFCIFLHKLLNFFVTSLQ